MPKQWVVRYRTLVDSVMPTDNDELDNLLSRIYEKDFVKDLLSTLAGELSRMGLSVDYDADSETISIDAGGLGSEELEDRVHEALSKAWHYYEDFLNHAEKVCSVYEAKGWHCDVGDFSGDEDLVAYEVSVATPPRDGEVWLANVTGKVALFDNYDGTYEIMHKLWNTHAILRNYDPGTDKDLLNWLVDELKGLYNEDELWMEAVIKQVGNEYRMGKAKIVDG
jgi:hypothetical protein